MIFVHYDKKELTLFRSVKVPYYNAGVQVEENAVYIKLQSKVGITVMWNGDDAVMVKKTLHKGFHLLHYVC